MKKKFFAFTALAVMLLLSSCGGATEEDGVYVDIYGDGWKYDSGNFTYDAEEIEVIDVSWCKGDINIVQAQGEVLSVSESGENLPEEERIHYLIEGNALKIKFWESGYFGRAEKEDKNLTIEMPTGISLKVKNDYGDIRFSQLSVDYCEFTSESGSIVFEKFEGREALMTTEKGDVRADSVLVNERFKADSSLGIVSFDYVYSERAEISNKSGDIRIGEIGGNLSLLSGKRGNIVVGEVKAEQLGINANSSEVSVGIGAGGAKIKFSSAGEIYIKSAMELNKKNEEYILGDGGCRIEVSLATGNMTVN